MKRARRFDSDSEDDRADLEAVQAPPKASWGGPALAPSTSGPESPDSHGVTANSAGKAAGSSSFFGDDALFSRGRRTELAVTLAESADEPRGVMIADEASHGGDGRASSQEVLLRTLVGGNGGDATPALSADGGSASIPPGPADNAGGSSSGGLLPFGEPSARALVRMGKLPAFGRPVPEDSLVSLRHRRNGHGGRGDDADGDGQEDGSGPPGSSGGDGGGLVRRVSVARGHTSTRIEPSAALAAGGDSGLGPEGDLFAGYRAHILRHVHTMAVEHPPSPAPPVLHVASAVTTEHVHTAYRSVVACGSHLAQKGSAGAGTGAAGTGTRPLDRIVPQEYVCGGVRLRSGWRWDGVVRGNPMLLSHYAPSHGSSAIDTLWD